jgi:hypothetical protein
MDRKKSTSKAYAWVRMINRSVENNSDGKWSRYLDLDWITGLKIVLDQSGAEKFELVFAVGKRNGKISL